MKRRISLNIQILKVEQNKDTCDYMFDSAEFDNNWKSVAYVKNSKKFKAYFYCKLYDEAVRCF